MLFKCNFTEFKFNFTVFQYFYTTKHSKVAFYAVKNEAQVRQQTIFKRKMAVKLRQQTLVNQLFGAELTKQILQVVTQLPKIYK